jgi:thiol-disulfide isomerase/thioredoxin
MTPQNQQTKAPWTATQIGLIVSAIILVVALAFTFYHGDRPNPTRSASTSNSAESSVPPLPENVMQASINLLDGQKTRLADFSGKVLIVNLWATWCGPCRQEIPHLIEIAKEYKSKGVEVIGLTKEDPDNQPEMVKQFSELMKINYPIGWVDDEMQSELMRGRAAIPQAYIIGRDGKILKHYVGFNPRVVPQMKAIIEAAASAE